MAAKIFIVSAPCGAGKTSLVAAAINRLKSQWPIEQVVTYTTRSPRNTERNGNDYHFIDTAEFEQLIENGFFLEWSTAYTAYYGSPRHIVDECKKGQSFIVILDRVGAQKVIEQVPDAILIWIAVPLDELKRRLLKRSTESADRIERRLMRAQVEMDLEQKEPLYHYSIVNDDFEQATDQLIDIVSCQLSPKGTHLNEKIYIQNG